MSEDRTRDPERDKQLSYEKDCRNSYGESRHAARKAIPKRKAWENRASRVAAKRDLSHYEGMTEEEQDRAESDARQDITRVGGWKKQPDTPLGQHVETSKILRERDDGKIDRDECYDRLGDLDRAPRKRRF